MMRKVKLQVQITVDGFMAGPAGEMNWMTLNWDDGLMAYVDALTRPVDGILLGRNLAEGFIPTWAGIAADSANPNQASGRKFTDTPKVVFSRTLTESVWDNTVVANGDLTDEVTKLKNKPGQDLIVYGGSQLVGSLIRANLIDEFHLFVNPAAIGSGLPIFNQLDRPQPLTLVKATPFDCGIVCLHYEPKKD